MPRGASVQPKPMPARGSSGTAALVRRLIGGDEPQRLLAGVNDLNRAHDDALERIAADRPEPGLARQRLHVGGQPVEIQAIARQRPDQIGCRAASRTDCNAVECATWRSSNSLS